MAELPHLGKHCSVSSCKHLDFLPFHCDGCGGTFCKEHRSKTDHQCTEHLLTEASGKYEGVRSYPCGFPGCEKRELSLIICDKCDTNFCLGHRHQRDHKCSALTEEPVKNAKTAEHVQKLLDSKGPVKRKGQGAKSAKTAAMVTLMKIKMKAEGPKGLPDTEKVYFNVVLPELVGRKEKPMFFSDKWSVGRVIDSIASAAGINNPNNTTAEKKLRLFSGASGDLLPTDGVLSEVLKEQEDLFSGSTVCLEYVTADCCHLGVDS